ncbi:hypothetical protein N9R27_03510, partial [Flavobacteriaceae bacterium]|nr:hypothetical protein [Flavobacteriaceae bacterium]
EEGKADFANYIQGLENGSASFSLKKTGIRAAYDLKYGYGFASYYDELYDRCKKRIAEVGSIHISETIGYGKEILSSRDQGHQKSGPYDSTAESDASGTDDVSAINTGDNAVDLSFEKAKVHCKSVGFDIKTANYRDCVMKVFGQYE